MTIWNILTADVRANPIALRHYFSRLRFAREDRRIKNFLVAAAPEVAGVPPQGGEGPVLFAVADPGYFNRFANMFVGSAAINSPQSAVHIHVIGADERAVLPLIEKIPAHYSVTFESADFSKMPGPLMGRYCQSMRFVRLAQFVKQSHRDYMALDIDGLFQKSFAGFSKEFAGDVGLIVRPQFADEGLHVNAGVVFMRATDASQNFMDHASAQMLRHLQHAPFIEKLDQRCLALAMDDCVKPLAADIYAFEPGRGHFYSAKGGRKNDELKAVFEKGLVKMKG